MSELPAHLSRPIADGLEPAAVSELLGERFTLEPDAQATGGACFMVPREQLRDVIRFLRDDERIRCDLLLDLTVVDYLAFPGWREERYGVVYLLRSVAFKHRIRLKVLVDEGDETMPTISDLYQIADWAEREAWDQYGIRFEGHPNLKRILNHHEFVGHPLRKDYPVQKRQHLSINDPMLDELTAQLERRGYTIVDHEATSVAGVDPQLGAREEGAA